MTRRLRHVRVSVRSLTQGKDADGWPTESYGHDRYQRLQTLAPLDGESMQRLQREGFYADWTATARARPAIPDTARLVTFDENGDPDVFLDVEKVLRRGRRQTILLKEVREVQS